MNRRGYYILAGHEPRVATLKQWATANRADWVVSKSKVPGGEVSTVFLGIDHRMFGEGPPVLFETMVFGGRMDEHQMRFCTWKEALAHHKQLVQQLRGYASDE